eukprot:TRINITY_DN12194_c0_g1_i1.p1 TRINITY_DN12194_c0_g1~~TRINITY_DN12194_c0_g1_i1.p1  ORF type:complete len:273 (+),score=26.12 TRINITY_DN12194_c0_g1_i1:113-931(+)
MPSLVGSEMCIRDRQMGDILFDDSKRERVREVFKEKQKQKRQKNQMSQPLSQFINKINNYLWYNETISNQTCQSYLISTRSLFKIRFYIGILCLILLMVMVNISSSLQMVCIYLTTWGVAAVSVYFILITAQMIIQYYMKYDNFIKRFWKFNHILFEFAISLQLLIILVFWGILYTKYNLDSFWVNLANVTLHGGFYLAIWIELAFNSIQFLYRHYIIVAIISAIYMIIFINYELQTGEDVYPDVNSKNLLSLVILFLLFVIQALQLSLIHI